MCTVAVKVSALSRVEYEYDQRSTVPYSTAVPMCKYIILTKFFLRAGRGYLHTVPITFGQ